MLTQNKRGDELISVVLGGKPQVKGAVFGVEIEFELRGELRGVDGSPISLKHWRKEAEGSVQNGLELVSAPLAINDMNRELDKIAKVMNENNRVIDLVDSPRAGVHIHVNMQDKTWRQLTISALIYYILENALVENCGKDREGNLFCLRLSDASGIKERLQYLPDQYQLMNSNGNLRYSALNFDSLFNFGTLEWRPLRTPVDFREIKPWLEAMNRIFREEHFDNPYHMMETVSADGPIAFARKVLGPQFSLIERNKNLVNQIQQGVWDVQDVVFMKQWS